MGAQLDGVQSLAISLSTAALVAAPFGAWAAVRGLTLGVAAASLGIAVLVPLLPYTLELLALRRMRVAAFGTLMALEPGIATLLGLAVLTQTPTVLQTAGVATLIVAGVGAQRTRHPGFDPLAPVIAPVIEPAGVAPEHICGDPRAWGDGTLACRPIADQPTRPGDA